MSLRARAPQADAARAGGAPLRSRSPISARTAMAGLFAVQLLLAGLIVWTDVAGRAPLGGDAPISPVTREPARKGDQTRPYSPREVPRRADVPRGREAPMPAPGEGLAFSRAILPGGGIALEVTGAIAFGDDARFAVYLDAMPAPPDAVALHSPGGSVQAALLIGGMIRARDLSTMVRAGEACISACPLILAGGAVRSVSRQAWIGVHQISFAAPGLMGPAQAAYEVQILKAEMMRFWQEMGVDAGIETLSMAVAPERVYFLLEEELTALNLATRIED
jgi:hypothetical protein